MQHQITRALLSVSDKEGIVDFARALAARKVQIISTGGTARLLRSQGVDVTEVSDLTGFPEIMSGRLKTLHPLVFGALLGRSGTDDAVMAEHGITPVDLVCVNLYPFAQTVARTDCTLDEAMEHIDIGGPAMIRAAAKNHERVAVVVRRTDYERVITLMDEHDGGLDDESRFDLAVAAFEHTARYDSAIANYLGTKAADYGISENENYEDDLYLPRTLNLNFVKQQSMRYGENPHQRAAFYRDATEAGAGSITAARQLQGRELSYNNVADADTALECVRQFEYPACVIVKHGNPCGVAADDDLCTAYNRAFSADRESAFGGIIAFNRPLDARTAAAIVSGQFCEVIAAPAIEEGAREAVAAKKNIRLLECGSLGPGSQTRLDFRRVNGGLLVQESDTQDLDPSQLRVVTRRHPTTPEMEQLLFAWKVCKFVKSNAIVYARDFMTCGIGCGQTSRVFAARSGQWRAKDAGLELSGCAMASDAFFPFSDGVEAAAASGVTGIIQPGGSIRDEEVIEAADRHGIAMVFTHQRHFRH